MLQYFQGNPQQANLFDAPQWIITPMPNNKWCMVLSGTLVINLVTGKRPGWRNETIEIGLNINPMFAYAGFDTANQLVTMNTEQYACYGSMNSIFDKDTAVNAGFAVDRFYPLFNGGGRILSDGSGVKLDVAVRDSDAVLLRVGYYLMAIGTITEQPIPPVL